MNKLAMYKLLRQSLNRLYLFSGVMSGASLLVLLLIIVTQMATRWFGISVVGLTAYAGYTMASALFFGLGYAFSQRAHIRVTLFVKDLGKYRHGVELWCGGISTLLAAYLGYFAVVTNYWSYRLGEISQTPDATPVWIPQLAMSFGTVIFAIAVLDRFVQVILGGHLKTDFDKTIGESSWN